MPTQTTFSLQRAAEPGAPLRVCNELYEYLGFAKTPYYITTISRGAFQKILPLLDESWEKDQLAHLQFEIETAVCDDQRGEDGKVHTLLSDTLNFTTMSDEVEKLVCDILEPEKDFRRIGLNNQTIVTLNFDALEKLKATKAFANTKAFIVTAPVPCKPQILINFLIIAEPEVVVDIINSSDVDQSIEIHFPSASVRP